MGGAPDWRGQGESNLLPVDETGPTGLQPAGRPAPLPPKTEVLISALESAMAVGSYDRIGPCVK